MGTRNLTIVSIDGKRVVAQYGQFDGYPSGQGQTIQEFLGEVLNDQAKMDRFKQNLRSLRWMKDGEADAEWEKAEALIKAGKGAKDDEMPGCRTALEKMVPHIHRNTAARILGLILESEQPVGLVDNGDFLTDSSCEWAYALDMDKEEVKVYSPGNREIATMPFRAYIVDGAMLLLDHLAKMADGRDGEEE